MAYYRLLTVTRRTFSTHVYKDVKSYKRQVLLDRILRVDHAGEFGADRIYAGQLAILGRSESAPVIQNMWDQEKEHLRKMQELLIKHRSRPSLLLPVWNVAGFLLGAGTALLGKESAMACTVAVEEVIAKHYNNQIRELIADDPVANQELLKTLTQLRDEEQHHHDTGIEHNAQDAPFYKYLHQTIKAGCVCAIWLAERI